MDNLPMLTFFYGGSLTEERINKEADRLTDLANEQVAKGKATEQDINLWKEQLGQWKKRQLHNARIQKHVVHTVF